VRDGRAALQGRDGEQRLSGGAEGQVRAPTSSSRAACRGWLGAGRRVADGRPVASPGGGGPPERSNRRPSMWLGTKMERDKASREKEKTDKWAPPVSSSSYFL
jgi:hypothetical protein